MKLYVLKSFLLFFLFIIGSKLFAQKPELVLYEGHQGVIHSICFSPNNKYALSGDQNGLIILWEVATGRILQTYSEHRKIVTTLAFLPDNKRFLSASNDGSILLWDINSKSFQKKMEGTRFALSADGKIMVADYGNLLRIYNIATGKSTKTISAHAKDVFSVRFSPDGKNIITGSFDKTAKIINSVTYAETKSFVGNTDAIKYATLSSDGKFMFTASLDSVVKRWDAATKKELNSMNGIILAQINDKKQLLVATGHDFKVLKVIDWTNWKEIKTISTDKNFKSATLSSDGKWCITASGENGTLLKVWEIGSWNLSQNFAAHTHPVLSVAISGDGKYAYTYRGANTLSLWDLTSGKNLRIIGSFNQALKNILFAPDSRHCLVRFVDNSAKLFSLSTGVEVAHFKGNAFEFSPDSKSLLVGTETGDFELWDLEKYKSTRTYTGHQYPTSAFAFSLDAKQILSGASDKTVRLWKTKSSYESSNLKGHEGEISAVSFSPDAKFGLSTSYDDNIKIWNLEKGKEIKSFKGLRNFVKYMSLPYDTKQNFSNLGDKNFNIWDLNEPDKLSAFTGHTSTVTSVNFSPDWKYVLSGDFEGNINFWDLDFAKIIKPLRGHKGIITSMRFSENSLFGISGSTDNTAKIWNLNAGQEKITLVGVDSTDWVVITPDGRFDGSENGITQLFYSVGNENISFSALKEKFYTPNLLARTMADEKIAAPDVDFSKGLKSPTEVKLIFPPNLKLSAGNSITVNVEATDKGGGVSEIKFWHNGKLISPETSVSKTVPKSKNVIKSFKITLVSGQNEIKAQGINVERTLGTAVSQSLIMLVK